MRGALLILLSLTMATGLFAQQAETLSFEGNTLFTEAQLLKALRRFDISTTPPLDATTADDAAYFLREFLFGQGLPEAEVEYRFSGNNVAFIIDEGPRYEMGELKFSGSDAIPTERMQDIFVAEVRQQTHAPFGQLRYVESAMQSGGEKIRQALIMDGFLSARVTVTPTYEDKVVNVLVEANSGPQSRITSVRLVGENLLPDVLEKGRAMEGQVYKPGQELLLRSQVEDSLKAQGYFDSLVTEEPSFDSVAGQVGITLNVHTGERYRFGSILVTGNRRTLIPAILRRLGIKPGTPYDASVLDAGVRRLWFSGAFSDVGAKKSAGAEKTVDVALDVTEGAARQISTTLGYGQWQGAFADGTYTDRNFFGTLNRFSLRGLISMKSRGVIAELTDPWFLQSEMSATISAFYARLDMPAFAANQLGAGLTIERQNDQNNLTGWRAGYQWKTVTNSNIYAGQAVEDALDDYTLSQLTFHQTLDRRNDLLSPMKGYLLQWEGNLASQYLGGEVSYFRLTAQATWYLPLRTITPERPFVPFIVLNHRAGLMVPFGDTDAIPVPERFFLGGPDTVRSFQLDGLGPRDQYGNPEGGTAFLLANAEIQFPIWRALYVATFLDVGNLAPSIQEMDWSETRVAPGVGVRLYTPIGAVRADYGYNLIRRDGDPIGAWQIGFGFTF